MFDDNVHSNVEMTLGRGGVVRIVIGTDVDGIEEVVGYVRLQDLTNTVRDFNERHRANG